MTTITGPFVGDLTELHIAPTHGGIISAGTLVGNVSDFGDLDYQKNIIEYSAFGTAYKGKVPGKKNVGDFTIRLNWNPADADHATLKTAYDGTSATYFSIVWRLGAENARADITGYVASYKVITEEEDVVSVEITIAITGDVDFDENTDVAINF